MKRLSVIIPGYNTKKEWWQRCVASVQAALGTEDEIIVVDDGSQVPVERDWFAVEVKVIRRENGGLSAARNTGMEAADGKYLAFVDSDDEVVGDAFDKSIAELEAQGGDMAVFGVQTIWVEECLAKIDLPGERTCSPLMPHEVNDLLHKRVFNYAWNKVYRRAFLEEHNITFDRDGMPCEDMILNLQMVMARAKWCSVDAVGYKYYREGLTLLSKYKPSNFVGLHHGSDTWKAYKDSSAEAKKLFGTYGELNEESLRKAEKENLLKPRSPYWLSGPYNFFRNLFYVRPIRRWRIKRLYQGAFDYE